MINNHDELYKHPHLKVEEQLSFAMDTPNLPYAMDPRGMIIPRNENTLVFKFVAGYITMDSVSAMNKFYCCLR